MFRKTEQISAGWCACYVSYNKTNLEDENNPTEGGKLFPHMGEL